MVVFGTRERNEKNLIRSIIERYVRDVRSFRSFPVPSTVPLPHENFSLIDLHPSDLSFPHNWRFPFTTSESRGKGRKKEGGFLTRSITHF